MRLTGTRPTKQKQGQHGQVAETSTHISIVSVLREADSPTGTQREGPLPDQLNGQDAQKGSI